MSDPRHSFSLPAGPAIVTGASSGIGAAIVAALEAAGTQVAALARRDTDGPGIRIACDVTDEAQVRAAVAEAEARLGPPGLLVSGAGVVSEHGIADLEHAEWQRVIDASLTGAYHLMRAVAPGMAARGGGSIVALSSGWAARGYPRGAHYAAAKAGLEALVRSVAAELGPAGVRVNAVAPGPVRTPMLDDLPDFDEAHRSSIIPLGRIGEPSDVVGPVLFLLGNDASHITGQVIQVSGGLVMK